MFHFGIFCLFLTLVRASSVSITRVKTFRPRIINGDNATLGQFPWQAALQVDGPYVSWFCGGSIISEEWILTAAHCVYEAKQAQVSTGLVVRNGGTGTVSQSNEFIWHKNYNPDTLANDIGLLKLSNPLVFDENTKSVALSSDFLEANIPIIVSGWGYISDLADSTDVLQYTELVTISNRDCEEAYGGEGAILEEMVCAKSPTSEVKSTCSGDSGGGAVANSATNPLHVGVVSFVSSTGCETGFPSGYTRTATYREWIKNNTKI